MFPVFKLGKNERIYITAKYITNGKWMVAKAHLFSPLAPKALKAISNYPPGTYGNGISGGITRADTPDCDAVVPKRTGYKLLRARPLGVSFRGETDTVMAYVFIDEDNSSLRVGVDPGFVPVLRMGYAFAKDAKSPILVLSGSTLNDELLAVVMPIRLGDE